MFRALVQRALHFLERLRGRFPVMALRGLTPPGSPEGVAPARASYQRLEKIILTDAVARTLFDDFATHRRGKRRDEEIGWVLLGVRQERDATALATLPAGTQRSAGVAHVRFNSQAQALASRIVRTWDKRLAILGVVHTHPGSLRHPSDGDFQGDSQWVGQLRGNEGVFGIGTADVRGAESLPAAPTQPHRQILGELCFSWYALGERERRYRPLPVEIILGPDLAKPLHPLWDLLEERADELERLCVQQAKVSFEVMSRPHGKTLAVSLPLADGAALKVLLDGRETKYLVQQRSGLAEVDPAEPRLDRAVYLILAELCGPKAKKPRPQREVSYSV